MMSVVAAVVQLLAYLKSADSTVMVSVDWF